MVKIEKELHLGFMTNQELAEWFGGIKEKSFRSTRAKKLEILSEYAEFENLRGKVKITKIIKPVYTKGSEDYKLIKEKTIEQWNNTGLDTCRLVSKKIKNKYGNKLTVKDNTLYTYTCQSKRELWGKSFVSEGEIGFCVYELCKLVNNECVELTDEERILKNKLLKKYFGNVDEKLIYIKNMIEEGEISEEEGWEEFKDIVKLDKNYFGFIAELEELIKNKVVRATRITTYGFKTN